MWVKTEPTFNGADDTREKEIEMKNIQIFKDSNKGVDTLKLFLNYISRTCKYKNQTLWRCYNEKQQFSTLLRRWSSFHVSGTYFPLKYIHFHIKKVSTWLCILNRWTFVYSNQNAPENRSEHSPSWLWHPAVSRASNSLAFPEWPGHTSRSLPLETTTSYMHWCVPCS